MGGKLVGVVGPKQSGKDTFARALTREQGFARLAFADRLKYFALAVNPLVPCPPPFEDRVYRLDYFVNLHGWDVAKETYPEVRRLLQEMGLAARLYLGERVWLDPVMRAAAEMRENGVPVVITDVRFPNEYAAVREAGGLIVRITRPRLEDPADAHESEQLWRTCEADAEYENVGSVWELEQFAGHVAVRM